MGKYTLLSILAFLLLPIPSLAQESQEYPEFDTIAGHSADIEFSTEHILALESFNGRKFTFTGDCPNGFFEERSYVQGGIVSFRLVSPLTDRAGRCSFQLIDDRGFTRADGSFSIFAAEVYTWSLDILGDRALRVGESVTLRGGRSDQFGNSIAGNLVLVSADGDVTRGEEDGESVIFSFIPEVSDVTLTLVDPATNERRSFRFQADGGEVVTPKSSPTSNTQQSRGDAIAMLLGQILKASLIDDYNSDDESNATTSSDGEIHSFDVEIGGNESTVRVNEQYDLTIIAKERSGRTKQDYVERIIVETTDVDAVMPTGSIRFSATDRGIKNLPLALMFQTPGEQTVSVRDEIDPDNIYGSVKVWVLGNSAEPVNRVITVHEQPGVIAGSDVTVSGTAPAYTNLELVELDNGDQIEVARTASDKNGTFSFQVVLDGAQEKHVLMVRDPEGRVSDSKTITIRIDASAPQIQSIILTPEKVEPGESVSVSVEAEEGQTGQVTIGDMDVISLQEKPSNTDGMSLYTTTFAAPDVTPRVTVTVALRDSAGNTTTETRSLTIEKTIVPVEPVKNTQVDVTGDDVTLCWDLVTNAKKYRVYYGTKENDLDRYVDTDDNSTCITVNGLPQNAKTYFSITAITADGRESEEHSDITEVEPEGSLFNLRAVGLANGIRVLWDHPAGITPREYRIQYGVQSGQYSEERRINPGMTRYDLPDLINGVPYLFRLSALRSDGSILTDTIEVLAVAGENGQPGIIVSPTQSLPYDSNLIWRHGAPVGGSDTTPQPASPSGDSSIPHTAAPGRITASGPVAQWIFAVVLFSIFGASLFYFSPSRRDERLLRALAAQRYLS